MLFYEWLKSIGINPNIYMSIVKDNIKLNKLNPENIKFSDNPKYKLNYDGINFGANKYNDYIIYSLKDILEAFKQRLNYRKRAYEVMRRAPKLSRSYLSYYILW